MIKAITDIYSTDPNGFWLNVLSNVPFLFFDLIFIVIVLPIAIDAYRLFRTRHARKIALQSTLDALEIVLVKIGLAIHYHLPSQLSDKQGIKKASDQIEVVITKFHVDFANNFVLRSTCLEATEVARVIVVKDLLDSYLLSMRSCAFSFAQPESSRASLRIVFDGLESAARILSEELAKRDNTRPENIAATIGAEAHFGKLMAQAEAQAEAETLVPPMKATRPRKAAVRQPGSVPPAKR